MSTIVNIAAYKFVHFDSATLSDRRDRYYSLAEQYELKGTILVSTEGINLFLAGPRDKIVSFWTELTSDKALNNLQYKESPSDHQPFTRLLVKIKKEIIAFGIDDIEPQKYTSRHLDPTILKQWLDEGREVKLLDTRNDYEYRLGTFDNAITLDIDHFRQFPEAAKSIDPALKKQPVVTFCTGGIRCEKAAPYLEQLGFEDIYQLDGGILKYFEECGGEHYNGECFVFDHRVGVDAQLSETPTKMCFVCQQPLSPEDQNSPDYVATVSCPYCVDQVRHPETTIALDERNRQITAIAVKLDSNEPYDNFRPLRVAEKYKGWKLIDWVCDLFQHLSHASWQRIIESDRIRLHNEPVAAEQIVKPGQVYQHLFPSTIEPAVNTDVKIIHEDEALFVVDKPAPLPMHPCGRFNRNTLTWILNQVYVDEKPRMAHRLDANTSGLVVFARKRKWAGLIQTQFENKTVKKEYLALVHGHPATKRWTIEHPIGVAPGQGGIREINPEGAKAITHVELIDSRDDGTSLLHVTPITGRTNQIRIHLWNDGLPIIGDPVYRVNQNVGNPHTLSVEDPPMCLHAASLELVHPLDQQTVRYQAASPCWLDNGVSAKTTPV